MKEREIVQKLANAGHAAYFVGGCVRDFLGGRTPKDIDIATSATPAQIKEVFPDADAIGAHFGVMLVDRVEVATFRSDGAYKDGRRPEDVTYETTPEADAARRDFTINGMFKNPLTGEVLDFHNGTQDLRDGIIRCIGNPDERFEEDALRLLRAVRFAAKFRFVIDRFTRQAMNTNAHLIQKVSAERVNVELTRILTQGGAHYGFRLLKETGLLPYVLPEIVPMIGCSQPPEYHPEGDVWQHTMIMLNLLDDPSPTLAWGVLLHDVRNRGEVRVLTVTAASADREKETNMPNNIYPTQKGIWNNTEHFSVLPKNKVELVHGFPYRNGCELSSRMIRLSVDDPLPPNTLWWSWVFAPGFGAKVIGIEALVEVEWDNLSQYEREIKEEGFARGIGATSRC